MKQWTSDIEILKAITRRHFFQRSATGIGAAALASLANQRLFAAEDSAKAALSRATPDYPLAPKPPHFAGKAKHVIYIHMAGSPSQLDLFDHKPKLNELNGQPCPESLFKKERFAFIKGVPKMLGTPHTFAKHGQCGAEVSNLLPTSGDRRGRHRHRQVDGHRAIQSRTGAALPEHRLAQLGRPSMGSWLTYGLGSENQNLPGFVVLISSPQGPDGGTSLWGSGFLPSVYQGVQFRSQGDPVLYVSNPPGMDAAAAAANARRDPPAQRAAAPRDRRSGNAHADRAVRDGLPHADQRARA